jgi:hypothetical protein
MNITNKDKIKDWYEIASKGKTPVTSIKPDKDFKKHFIKPSSMIAFIGPTGQGKTTVLVEFMDRKRSWTRIIIFSSCTVDELLLNFVKEKIEGVELIDDVNELPEINDVINEGDKSTEKLIVFDDIINLNKKELKKIEKWFNSARKAGWTCIAMCQNYTDMPTQMRRNTMYWILFRLNDMNTINQILKNHNNNGDSKELVKKAYFEATSAPKNFFMIDLSPLSQYRYRHNFLDIIKI